jgi:uncharacterized protein (TIGR00251 family)
MALDVTQHKEAIQFSAAIQPRASKNEISGVMNGALKIRLTSPPVEGAANKACIKFIAKRLGVSASKVDIVGGLTSKNKIIRVEGMDETAFLQKIFPSQSS